MLVFKLPANISFLEWIENLSPCIVKNLCNLLRSRDFKSLALFSKYRLWFWLFSFFLIKIKLWGAANCLLLIKDHGATGTGRYEYVTISYVKLSLINATSHQVQHDESQLPSNVQLSTKTCHKETQQKRKKLWSNRPAFHICWCIQQGIMFILSFFVLGWFNRPSW